MIRPAVRRLHAVAFVSALLATGAAADPWMSGAPPALRGPATGTSGLPSRGGSGLAAPIAQSESGAGVLPPARHWALGRPDAHSDSSQAGSAFLHPPNCALHTVSGRAWRVMLQRSSTMWHTLAKSRLN
jgi:hypothetical protein